MERTKLGSFTEKISQQCLHTFLIEFQKFLTKLYRIDDAMKAGFGWEHGPFEIWDAIGVEEGIEIMKAEGKDPAAWVTEMLANGQHLSIQ